MTRTWRNPLKQTNTHLPTVWLASCLTRLNCFFMLSSQLILQVSKSCRSSALQPTVALRRRHSARKRASVTLNTFARRNRANPAGRCRSRWRCVKSAVETDPVRLPHCHDSQAVCQRALQWGRKKEVAPLPDCKTHGLLVTCDIFARGKKTFLTVVWGPSTPLLATC